MNLNAIVQQAGTYQPKALPKKAVQPVASEPQTAQQNNPQIRSSDKGIALVEQMQAQQRSTIYDQPSYNNGKAIGEYRAIAMESRREEIKDLIGVSVYA